MNARYAVGTSTAKVLAARMLLNVSSMTCRADAVTGAARTVVGDAGDVGDPVATAPEPTVVVVSAGRGSLAPPGLPKSLSARDSKSVSSSGAGRRMCLRC